MDETTKEEATRAKLASLIKEIDHVEAQLAEAEEAAGLEPAPSMPLDERLARLRAAQDMS